MSKLIWKPIKGFEKSYAISNLAKVKSFICKEHTDYEKKWSVDSKGNKRVYLYNGARFLERKVSRLMVETFLGETRSWIEVIYKDGNKLNCALDNLELKL